MRNILAGGSSVYGFRLFPSTAISSRQSKSLPHSRIGLDEVVEGDSENRIDGGGYVKVSVLCRAWRVSLYIRTLTVYGTPWFW